MSKAGSFGARRCKRIRDEILSTGTWDCLPVSWRRKWMVQRIIATPPWADMCAIRRVYEEVRILTETTGEMWTVGHQVPLNHPRVCGLHVPWNLKAEPARINFSKGNAWCDEHGELFCDPEQFKLW